MYNLYPDSWRGNATDAVAVAHLRHPVRNGAYCGAKTGFTVLSTFDVACQTCKDLVIEVGTEEL